MPFDTPKGTGSLRGTMKWSECLQARWPGAILAILLAHGAGAGEKLRFTPANAETVPTRPARSVRESIEQPSFSTLNGVGMNGAASVAGPLPTAVTAGGRGRNESEDQSNWIFRDASTAKGVQEALGVVSYGESNAQATERDSVAVIQDYFARQRSRAAAEPTAGSPNPSWNTPFANASGMQTSGNTGFNSGARLSGDTAGSANLFGDTAFPNTLNSDNPVMRRYFRELYTSSGDGRSPADSALGGLNGPTPAPATGFQLSPLDPTQPRQQQSLSQKAALVKSLSEPAMGGSSLDVTLSPGPQPVTMDNNRLPTVNQGNLFERRNGLIEIPGRRF